MVLTYNELINKFKSDYQIQKPVLNNEYYKIENGLYSDKEFVAVLDENKLSIYQGSTSGDGFGNYHKVDKAEVSACVLSNDDGKNSLIYLTKDANDKVHACFVAVKQTENGLDQLGTIIDVKVATQLDMVEAFINAWTALNINNKFTHTGKNTLYIPVSDNLHGSVDLQSAIENDASNTPTYYYYVADSDVANTNLLKHDFLWVKINNIISDKSEIFTISFNEIGRAHV